MPPAHPLPPGGGALRDLAAVDLAGLRPPPEGGVSCLSDVRAPLLGPAGAAAVFGPQKGASPAQVARLEDGLARLAGCSAATRARPAPGQPGGTGYGFAAAWGAQIGPGAVELGRLAGLDQALAGAGLVITGEGRYDETSGTGKVAGAVFAAAAAAGVPAALVAGQVAAGPPPPWPGPWAWPTWRAGPGRRWPIPAAGSGRPGRSWPPGSPADGPAGGGGARRAGPRAN